MSLVVMNKLSSFPLQIVNEYLADSYRRYLPASRETSSLLSPCLAALDVAVPDTTKNVGTGDGPIV